MDREWPFLRPLLHSSEDLPYLLAYLLQAAGLRRRRSPHFRRCKSSAAPNNSLQLTRLACGELERALPAGMRENG